MPYTVQITITQPDGLRCFSHELTAETAVDAYVAIRDMLDDVADGHFDPDCLDDDA